MNTRTHDVHHGSSPARQVTSGWRLLAGVHQRMESSRDAAHHDGGHAAGCVARLRSCVRVSAVPLGVSALSAPARFD